MMTSLAPGTNGFGSSPFGRNYFRPIKTETAQRAMEYFDHDGDGALGKQELKWGARVLDFYGEVYNPEYGNIGNLFTRLARTLDKEPSRIDKNNDGKVSYNENGKPGQPQTKTSKPSEIELAAEKDGNSDTVSVRDIPHVFGDPMLWPPRWSDIMLY